jgi:deazaflavin-dependent oxidoreductase (nitroreductase family)
MLNRVMRVWIHLGLPPGKYHMLAVRGRRSGRLLSTPVSVMMVDGQRWLVAPYGPRNWVKNARVAGQVTLSRGGHSDVVAVQEEHDPARCAQVLKVYLNQEPITRPFFDAQPGSPLRDFEAEAHRHPVFRILEMDRETPTS